MEHNFFDINLVASNDRQLPDAYSSTVTTVVKSAARVLDYYAVV